MKRLLVAGLYTCYIILLSYSSYSLDTIEPFDIGLSDFELYAGYSVEDKAFSVENAYGAGIIENFSLIAALEFCFPVNGRGSMQGVSLGLIYTPLSNDIFELDLIAGYTWIEPNIIPAHSLLAGFELNLYLGAISPYVRFEYTPEAIKIDPDYQWAHPAAVAPGLFFTIKEGMEIFFELPIELVRKEPTVFAPGVGFNVLVNDWMEVLFDFGMAADTDGNTDYGFSIGTVMGI